MPISDKIIEMIRNSSNEPNFKKLMLQILNEEDNGVFRFKLEYEKLLNEYLKEKEGENDD
jgi:hypothetical protein